MEERGKDFQVLISKGKEIDVTVWYSYSIITQSNGNVKLTVPPLTTLKSIDPTNVAK